jgi:hypothetical protein
MELHPAPKLRADVLRRLNSQNYKIHIENIERFRRSLSLPLHGHPDHNPTDSAAPTSRRSGSLDRVREQSPLDDPGTARTNAHRCSAQRDDPPADETKQHLRSGSSSGSVRKAQGSTFGTAARKTFVDEIAARAAGDARELYAPPPSLVSFSRSVSISTASRFSDCGKSSVCSGDYNPVKPQRRLGGVIGSSRRFQNVTLSKSGCSFVDVSGGVKEGDSVSLFSEDQKSVASSQRTARGTRRETGLGFARAPRFRDPGAAPVKDPVGPGAYDVPVAGNNPRHRRATSVRIATAGREIEPMHSNAVVLPSEVVARQSMPGPGSYHRELVWGRGGLPFALAGVKNKIGGSDKQPTQRAHSNSRAQQRIAELAKPKHANNGVAKQVTEMELMARMFHARR